jgi:hypothetical protein
MQISKAFEQPLVTITSSAESWQFGRENFFAIDFLVSIPEMNVNFQLSTIRFDWMQIFQAFLQNSIMCTCLYDQPSARNRCVFWIVCFLSERCSNFPDFPNFQKW